MLDPLNKAKGVWKYWHRGGTKPCGHSAWSLSHNVSWQKFQDYVSQSKTTFHEYCIIPISCSFLWMLWTYIPNSHCEFNVHKLRWPSQVLKTCLACHRWGRHLWRLLPTKYAWLSWNELKANTVSQRRNRMFLWFAIFYNCNSWIFLDFKAVFTTSVALPPTSPPTRSLRATQVMWIAHAWHRRSTPKASMSKEMFLVLVSLRRFLLPFQQVIPKAFGSRQTVFTCLYRI